MLHSRQAPAWQAVTPAGSQRGLGWKGSTSILSHSTLLGSLGEDPLHADALEKTPPPHQSCAVPPQHQHRDVGDSHPKSRPCSAAAGSLHTQGMHLHRAGQLALLPHQLALVPIPPLGRFYWCPPFLPSGLSTYRSDRTPRTEIKSSWCRTS